MFDGNYRQEKKVSLRPTQSIPKLSSSNHLITPTKTEITLHELAEKRKNRHADSLANDSATKIQATYRMYLTRKSLSGIKAKTHNQKCLLGRRVTQISSSYDSLSIFCNLLAIRENPDLALKVRRSHQFSDQKQKENFETAAIRAINSDWFNHPAFRDHEVLFLPWIFVKNSNNSSTRMHVLKKYLLSETPFLALKPYFDGNFTLKEISTVVSELSDDHIHERNPSLFQFSPFKTDRKLDSYQLLELFTFAYFTDDTEFKLVNDVMKQIVKAVESCPKEEESMEDDDDEDEEKSIPTIIKIVNLLDPKIFLRSVFSLETLGSLVEVLLHHHPIINDILLLQSLSENNLVLKKFINFLVERLKTQTKVQIRKYIRCSNDFKTWFQILAYRLESIRDELWMISDPDTVATVELFLPIVPHLQELVVLYSSPGSDIKSIDTRFMLSIINTLSNLNTIRTIPGFNETMMLQNPNHPLVMRLNAVTHPASNSDTLVQTLDDVFGGRLDNLNLSNKQDLWLCNCLQMAPGILSIEGRYKLFKKFTEKLQRSGMARTSPPLKVPRNNVYDAAFKYMLTNNNFATFNVKFVDDTGKDEPAVVGGFRKICTEKMRIPVLKFD